MGVRLSIWFLAVQAGAAGRLASADSPAEVPPPGTGPLRLETTKDEVCLATGSDRLKLLARRGQRWRWVADPVNNESVDLAGGYRIVVEDQWKVSVWQRGEEVIGDPLGGLAFSHKWLQEDAYFGGRAAANQVRSMAEAGGGAALFLANLVPVGQGALAVLSWRSAADSRPSFLGQHLVRITATPQPDIQCVRWLDMPPGPSGGRWAGPEPRRLFAAGGKVLLFGPAGHTANDDGPLGTRLVEIAPNGETSRVVANLPPARYPIGLLDSRWLVLVEVRTWARHEPELLLRCFDLQRRRALALGVPCGYPYSQDRPRLYGHRVLAFQEQATCIATIPSGSTISVPYPGQRPYRGLIGRDQCLWQDLLVTLVQSVVYVHDANTGELVAALPMVGGVAPTIW